MDKFNTVLLKLMKYLSAVVVVATVFDLLGFNTEKPEIKAWDYFFQTAGVITVLWCFIVVYFFFSIAFNQKIRNTVVRKLAGIKEHDERETYLTGVISKKTFISMTGVLFLFLSSLNINIYKASEEEIKNGKHGYIAIGLRLSLLAPQNAEKQNADISKKYYIKYNGLPLTANGIVLIVLALQIGSFYYFSKKENSSIEG